MELACPRCPVCGAEPEEAGLLLAAITGGTQIMCPTEACQVFMWDGTLADGGLAEASILPDEPDADGVTRARPATEDEIRDAIEGRESE